MPGLQTGVLPCPVALRPGCGFFTGEVLRLLEEEGVLLSELEAAPLDSL